MYFAIFITNMHRNGLVFASESDKLAVNKVLLDDWPDTLCLGAFLAGELQNLCSTEVHGTRGVVTKEHVINPAIRHSGIAIRAVACSFNPESHFLNCLGIDLFD